MNNVVNDYTDYIVEQFRFYAKKTMEKYYIASIFNEFIEEYILVRYYNIYPQKQNIKTTISFYLNKKLNELKTDNPDKIKSIIFMAKIFNSLIRLNCNIEAEEVNKIEKELISIRNEYGLTEELEFSKEYREFRKNKNNFIKAYSSEEFMLEIKSTKHKKISNTTLKYNIKMPELYSKESIDKVFNEGLISEDKLFIQYNLIAIKVLEEIINYDYTTSYLVDFNIELFKKKEKLNRLLKIIDNDITKEKVILKVPYSSFNKERDEIFTLINNGYNFALIKDKDYKEDDYISLFKCIIDSEV